MALQRSADANKWQAQKTVDVPKGSRVKRFVNTRGKLAWEESVAITSKFHSYSKNFKSQLAEAHTFQQIVTSWVDHQERTIRKKERNRCYKPQSFIR